MGSLVCSQRRGRLSPKKIKELAIIKLNHAAVKLYKEKYGKIPEMDVTPANDDFKMEEVSDIEDEGEEDYDLEYEELTEDEQD